MLALGGRGLTAVVAIHQYSSSSCSKTSMILVADNHSINIQNNNNNNYYYNFNKINTKKSKMVGDSAAIARCYCCCCCCFGSSSTSTSSRVVTGLVAAAAAAAVLMFSSAAAVATANASMIDAESTLGNIPQMLSGGDECESLSSATAAARDCSSNKAGIKRIQRPKSRKAESCTLKCVTTCIRGGAGEGPLNAIRPLVVFKQGFRSRQYCLVECSDICNLIKESEDGP